MEQKQGGVTENYLYFDPKAHSAARERHQFPTSFGEQKTDVSAAISPRLRPRRELMFLESARHSRGR